MDRIDVDTGNRLGHYSNEERTDTDIFMAWRNAVKTARFQIVIDEMNGASEANDKNNAQMTNTKSLSRYN